nr:hypothetical protein [Massilia eurypsychrophila]
MPLTARSPRATPPLSTALAWTATRPDTELLPSGALIATDGARVSATTTMAAAASTAAPASTQPKPNTGSGPAAPRSTEVEYSRCSILAPSSAGLAAIITAATPAASGLENEVPFQAW